MSTPGVTGGAHAMEPTPQHRATCDTCKRMKIKCKWDQDGSCNRCLARRTECTVTNKARKQREKKKENYLAKVEERLQRMEKAMAKSKLNLDSDTTRLTSDEIDHQGDIHEKLSMLKINSKGKTAFVGSSSGFSIFSPQGLRWITEMTGNMEFEIAISSITSIPEAMGELFNPSMWYAMSEEEREPLPPLDIAQLLIQMFFNGWNRTLQLYDEGLFLARFSQKYPVTYSEDIGWYASLNVVFSIGWILYGQLNDQNSFRNMKNIQDQKWWKWFRNASSSFIDLQFKEETLLAVQAMVGMTALLQALPNPFPSSVMIASALRVAQSIGLHRNLREGFGLSPAEVEERCNVFWIAVVMERALIHRYGRPSAIHEGDIGVHLPRETVPLQELVTKPERFSTIRPMATLSLLRGRIYNKLYSAKSLTKSKLERLRWVDILDRELQYWKDLLPVEIRPGHELKCHEKNILPVLAMQFEYFDALTTIHRVSLPYSSWGKDEFTVKSEIEGLQINPRVFASAAIRVSAARSVIGLLKVCNLLADLERNVTRIFFDYYPLTASLVLFANILQNPYDPQALSDIELMKSVTTFLSDFLDDNGTLGSSVLVKTYLEVNNLAVQHVKAARANIQKVAMRSRQDTILAPSTGADAQDMRSVASVNLTRSLSGINHMNDPMSASPHSTASSVSSSSTTRSATPISQGIQIRTPTYASSTIAPSPLASNINSQELQNPGVQHQDWHQPHNGPYENNPYSNLDLTDMADPEDLLMLLDNSWFFPMTSPVINPNMSTWPPAEMDSNNSGNVWDGNTGGNGF